MTEEEFNDIVKRSNVDNPWRLKNDRAELVNLVRILLGKLERIHALVLYEEYPENIATVIQEIAEASKNPF